MFWFISTWKYKPSLIHAKGLYVVGYIVCKHNLFLSGYYKYLVTVLIRIICCHIFFSHRRQPWTLTFIPSWVRLLHIIILIFGLKKRWKSLTFTVVMETQREHSGFSIIITIITCQFIVHPWNTLRMWFACLFAPGSHSYRCYRIICCCALVAFIQNRNRCDFSKPISAISIR